MNYEAGAEALVDPKPKAPANSDSDESDDDIIEEAKDRYQQCEDADGSNRTDAVDDLRFLSGGLNQWDAEAARIRTAERRPCLTINNLPTYLHQVTNDQRQNKPSIKVHPVDDNADVETAEVIQGLIRHIEYDSNGSVAYDTAVNSAAAIGFGFFRLVTEYVDDRSDDQKLMFKRIRNALSVRVDPRSQEPDGSDMQFCFLETLVERDEFERQYPDAEACDSSLVGREGNAGWLTEESVLVTEYYRIKKTAAVLNLMSDGSKLLEGDEVPAGVKVVKKLRDSYRCAVEWFKLTGADVLERTEIKCKWIPVFPVYGDEIDIEGKVIRSGIIRHSKDSFKMYNYWMTCATEEVSLRPKTPFIGAVGQFETAKQQWANANTVSYAYVEYDPVAVGEVLAPPPQRQAMADIPTGMLAMAMHANDNKKATTGLYDSSLGARGNATSGKQEIAQQRQGDVANFHYSDNLTTTMRHVGRCIVNMLPHYYDGERVVRIMGEDETAEPATINKQVPVPVVDAGGQERMVMKVLNDLTVGTYDITVKAGPGFDTMRQEAAEFMTAAMQAAKDPITSQILGYLAMKNQDIPGAEEATKMLLKTLPPGIAEPEDGEEKDVVQTHKGPLPVDQVPQAIKAMDDQIQQLTAQGPEIQKQAEAVKAEAAKVEAGKAAIASQQQQLEAKMRELKLMEELAHRTLEAEATRAEADSNKTIADIKLMVSEAAVQRLEDMKQQAEQERAEEDGERDAVKNQQVEAKGQEDSGMQKALIEQLTQAVQLLSAPRKTTLQNDASGMPVSAISEPV